MSDQVGEDEDVNRLVEEIGRLRGQVAQLQQRVEQLDQLAHQDSLIDLPNRRGFLRELERLIARVSRYDTKAAMLFVDVDGLKTINDSFGHRAGDEALIQVADLLASGVRKSDVVRPDRRRRVRASCSRMQTRRARTRPRPGSST